MIGKLFPFGYSNLNSITFLEYLMGNENALLVDSRYSPKSRLPEWRREALHKLYKDRYRFGGELLGNKTFKDKGNITIAYADEGVEKLVGYLTSGKDVVLLCQCKDYDICHRKVIVDLVTVQLPEAEIVHLTSAMYLMKYDMTERQAIALAAQIEREREGMSVRVVKSSSIYSNQHPVQAYSYCVVIDGSWFTSGEDDVLSTPDDWQSAKERYALMNRVVEQLMR